MKTRWMVIGGLFLGITAPQLAHASELHWERGSARRIPVDAVSGGRDSNRTNLYVCRARFRGGMYIGKVVNGRCVIGRRGQEYSTNRWQILVGDAWLRWTSWRHYDRRGYQDDVFGYRDRHRNNWKQDAAKQDVAKQDAAKQDVAKEGVTWLDPRAPLKNNNYTKIDSRESWQDRVVDRLGFEQNRSRRDRGRRRWTAFVGGYDRKGRGLMVCSARHVRDDGRRAGRQPGWLKKGRCHYTYRGREYVTERGFRVLELKSFGRRGRPWDDRDRYTRWERHDRYAGRPSPRW